MNLIPKNNNIVEEICSIINNLKKELSVKINNAVIESSWNIGYIIVRNESYYNNRLEYGKAFLKELSDELTKYLGKGYSVSNLSYMRQFYKIYPNKSMLNDKISWSHYLQLIIIKDDDKRRFYEIETIKNKWSKRELKRQIDTDLFDRLLLSKGSANKETLYKLSVEGQTIEKSEDILKEPFVLEFLGIDDQKPILESELESTLIKHIESFMLELGKGFMFVGSQQRITIRDKHYHVDMVFYNKYLKSYVLIDLKSGEVKHEDIGQMNLYLQYYEKDINECDDNKPIGIILCTEKDNLMLEYALGGISSNLYASRYTFYIPDKEQLIKEVEKIINSSNNEDKHYIK